MKALIATTALVLSGFAASASVDTSEFDTYIPNVDVSTLTSAEVNTILSIVHSGDSEGEKRATIQALVK